MLSCLKTFIEAYGLYMYSVFIREKLFKDLTKIVRKEIKKSSRTIFDLFANSFVYILNLANKLRIITLQQLV